MKISSQRLKEIIKEEIYNINEASKYDVVKAKMVDTAGRVDKFKNKYKKFNK